MADLIAARALGEDRVFHLWTPMCGNAWWSLCDMGGDWYDRGSLADIIEDWRDGPDILPACLRCRRAEPEFARAAMAAAAHGGMDTATACPRCDRAECRATGLMMEDGALRAVANAWIEPWIEPSDDPLATTLADACDGRPVDWRRRCLSAKALLAGISRPVVGPPPHDPPCPACSMSRSAGAGGI